MLWETDSSQLGDKHLNPEEFVIREREELLTMAADKRIPYQAELEDQERSAGPRLHSSEIIMRLKRLSPRLKVLDGVRGHVALYYPKRSDEYDDVPYEPNRDLFFYDHNYVGGMPLEWMPEFSHVILDTSLLPVREYRGWRSVLIGLIKTGAITYQGAVKEFGEPRGPRGKLWHEQLQEFKQR